MVVSSHGQPDPAPRNPVSRRLEQVRQSNALDRMAFWKALGGKDGSGVSYASARSYHHDREPSISYVVAVSDTFDVPLRWLLTGHGPHTGTEQKVEDRRDELTQELEKVLLPLSIWGKTDLIRATFLAAVARLAALAESDGRKLSDEDIGGLARRLATFIHRGIPDHVLGELKPERIRFTPRRLADGTLALLHAVMTWIPDPSEKRTMAPTTDQEEPDDEEA